MLTVTDLIKKLQAIEAQGHGGAFVFDNVTVPDSLVTTLVTAINNAYVYVGVSNRATNRDELNEAIEVVLSELPTVGESEYMYCTIRGDYLRVLVDALVSQDVVQVLRGDVNGNDCYRGN